MKHLSHFITIIALQCLVISAHTQFYDVDFTKESPLATQEQNIIFADSWEGGCWNAQRKDGSSEGSCEDGLGNVWKQSQMQGEYSGKVVRDPVRFGKHAMKYEWHPDSYEQVEHRHSRNTLKKAMTHAGYAPSHTVERWYAFSIYFPSEGMAVDPNPMLFFQVHGRPDLHKGESWRQPMAAMNIIEGMMSYSFTYDTSSISPGNELLADNRTSIDIGHIADYYDRWIDVVWHCKFNPFGGGLLEIWMEGEKIADHRNIGFGYNDEVGGPQYSIGAYWYSGKGQENHWFFVDEVRIGNKKATYRDVAPRTGNHDAFHAGKENMVLVKGGEFMMGSNVIDAEMPPHRVVLDDFYIDKYEVTTGAFCKFLNANGNQVEGLGTWIDLSTPDCHIIIKNDQYIPVQGYEDHPVIEVSWYGARAYSEWTGKRLPTEAEWEYAARGGRLSKGFIYSGGDNPDKVAWYEENSGGGTHPVGTKKPNELGIHDMSGNVYEWCGDWYDAGYYKTGESINPVGPASGEFKVLRGGSWVSGIYIIRSTYRYEDIPSSVGDYNFGFRCVKDVAVAE